MSQPARPLLSRDTVGERGPFKLEYFFHIISHVGLSEWSHAMWYSSFMIAQSLKTLKKNGPKLEIFQTTIIPCFTINISSLFVIWKKKKKKICHNKNYATSLKMIILIEVQCTPDISRSCISRNRIYRGRMLDPIFLPPISLISRTLLYVLLQEHAVCVVHVSLCRLCVGL